MHALVQQTVVFLIDCRQIRFQHRHVIGAHLFEPPILLESGADAFSFDTIYQARHLMIELILKSFS
ncbi:MAG: hypothetical protein ACI83P_001451 [Janthinobacterium sp.]|jgi:hypothetical protein